MNKYNGSDIFQVRQTPCEPGLLSINGTSVKRDESFPKNTGHVCSGQIPDAQLPGTITCEDYGSIVHFEGFILGTVYSSEQHAKLTIDTTLCMDGHYVSLLIDCLQRKLQTLPIQCLPCHNF